MTKRALITGIAGPFPGTFLERVEASDGKLHAIDADLTDMGSLLAAVAVSRPDEVYNFAAQSSVGTSWDEAVATTEVNAVLGEDDIVRLEDDWARDS